jgi:hypothetical protein
MLTTLTASSVLTDAVTVVGYFLVPITLVIAFKVGKWSIKNLPRMIGRG